MFDYLLVLDRISTYGPLHLLGDHAWKLYLIIRQSKKFCPFFSWRCNLISQLFTVKKNLNSHCQIITLSVEFGGLHCHIKIKI